MGKKQRKNLQKLLAKKRQLQQIESNVAGMPLPNVAAPELSPKLPGPVTAAAELPTTNHSRELVRTFFSIVVIAAVLVAAIIFDHQRPDLKNFGDWLYSTLRLQG